LKRSGAEASSGITSAGSIWEVEPPLLQGAHYFRADTYCFMAHSSAGSRGGRNLFVAARNAELKCAYSELLTHNVQLLRLFSIASKWEMKWKDRSGSGNHFLQRAVSEFASWNRGKSRKCSVAIGS
jgi:hypothetical protein